MKDPKDSKPKPYTVEVPTAAPRFYVPGKGGRTGGASSSQFSQQEPPVGYCDFFPWSGNHLEDQFSENVIRQGYFDKQPPLNPTETQSAKGVLFAALKHKSGLNALSTVFTSVLGQRRHGGQITGSTSFKPPPRVTVTDSRREQWLKDLANPAMSLRKLSRTIPHGVRGKLLLEQCLNKGLPMERAVWLVKCVGANEIRAFKRKGVNGTVVMGGEAKWIKDWTICVEQFIEDVVFAFDKDGWKNKVNYA